MLYRFFWILIVLEVMLGGAASWYESEHLPHTAGYRPLLFMALVVLIAAVQIVNKVQDITKSKGRLSGQDFLESYTTLLTDAIEALQDVNKYNEQQLYEAKRKILKLIGAVVVEMNKEEGELGISANLMVRESTAAHSTGDKFHDYVFFCDPQRAASSYAGVLCVKVWASEPQTVHPQFALPIDNDTDRVLFGAPGTYVSGHEVVISNVHDKKGIDRRLDGQPNVVKKMVHNFFAAQKYQTFVSIPVKNSDKVIAVLNVQADRTGLFGRQTKQAAEMKKFVDPFCTILGILTALAPPNK